MSNYDPLEEVEEAFNSFPLSSLERRAFREHLHKVLIALEAINDVDSGISISNDSKYICECIYDFDAQDMLEKQSE